MISFAINFAALPCANKRNQTDRKSSKAAGPFLPYGYEASSAGKGKTLMHSIRATQEVISSYCSYNF